MNRSKLLHLVPYNYFVPSRNGGALRCFHLCVELSKHYEVTLLTYQSKSTLLDERFSQIEVLNPLKSIDQKGKLSKIKKALLYRWYRRSIEGPAEAVVLDFYPVIKKLSQTHKFDIVLMEHLSSIQLGKCLKRHFPNAIRIADQHNIDHLLFAQNHDLKDNANQKRYEHIKQQESAMYAYADYFLACSRNDVKGLQAQNQNKIKGIVVPNGTEDRHIDLEQKDFSKPHLLFCGSLDYLPNKNGLLWFYHDIWPELKAKIPGVKLTVVGRNGYNKDYTPLKQDEKIDFIGEVEDVAPYYQKSSMAIVPLLEGSGTRVKILDAMTFGVPVVCTTIGADGIDYTNNYNILIADTPKQFANTIVSNYNTDNVYNIQQNAFNLVKQKYEWPVIVRDLVVELLKLNKN
jgi:glycosyltransferase involved in cell wall biosynthesis